jgi:hypothetical protein
MGPQTWPGDKSTKLGAQSRPNANTQHGPRMDGPSMETRRAQSRGEHSLPHYLSRPHSLPICPPAHPPSPSYPPPSPSTPSLCKLRERLRQRLMPSRAAVFRSIIVLYTALTRDCASIQCASKYILKHRFRSYLKMPWPKPNLHVSSSGSGNLRLWRSR